MPNQPKDYFTPSGRIETSIHQVNHIGIGEVRKGDTFIAKALTIKTSTGLKYRIELFADDEEDLTVSFG